MPTPQEEPTPADATNSTLSPALRILRERSFWLSGLVAASAAAGFLYLWVGSLLSAPAPRAVGPPPESLKAEVVEIPSESGSALSAWFAAPPEPRAGVVLLHCLRCNRLDMLPRAELLWRAGYAVLLPDLQAHGESPGEAVTFGHLESRDARAAIAYLRDRLGGLPIAGLGASLGGAAFLLAPGGPQVDALVLESVYPTIEEAVSNRIAIRLGPLSSFLAPLLLAQLEPRLGVAPKDLRPIDHIRALECPVLLLSGTDDLHTKAQETQRLFAAAPEPKQLWLVPGAAHQDLFRFSPEMYSRNVLSFLDEHLPDRRLLR